MKRQLILTIFIPILILFALIVFFNVNTYKESMHSLVCQNLEMESSMILSEISSVLRENDTIDGSLSKYSHMKMDSVLKDFQHLHALHIYNSVREIYAYPLTPNISRSESAKLAICKLLRVAPLFKSREIYLSSGNVTLKVCMELQVSTPAFLTALNLIVNILIVSVFFIGIFLAVNSWISNAMERPLALMLSAQNKLARGDYEARLHTEFVRSKDLLNTYNSFNNLAQELQRSRDLLENKNRKLAELNEDYRNLNEKLEIEVQKKTKELKEYFYLLTHDLKVPLAAASGYVSLLSRPKTGELNEKQRKFLSGISMAQEYLLSLVRNMIDSLKFEEGNIKFFFELFDIDQLLSEVETSIVPIFREHEISLKLVKPKKTPIMVYADRLKIAQVLSNLLSNACRHSPAGTEVLLSIEERPETVYVCIQDNGEGIPKEHIEQIFNKFYQLKSEDRYSGGAGLGLYIVKRILDGHNKTIHVESELNKGTTFFFELDRNEKLGELQSGVEVV